MSFQYLGQPYGSDDAGLREIRYLAALHAKAALMDYGMHVYSPILESHEAAKLMSVKPHHFWMEYDLKLLEASASLIILPLAGWEKSKGLRQEILRAKNTGKPIQMMKCLNGDFFGIEYPSAEKLAWLGANMLPFRKLEKHHGQ